MKFRIIQSAHDNEYYLQRRRWFGWQTQSCYHHGAPGDYAYEFCSASNPYALIKHTIPEIEAEGIQPTLRRLRKQSMFSLRPPKLRKFIIVDLEKATCMFREHQETNPDVTDFMPPGPIPFICEREDK